jgi:hypothetical protein
MNEKNDSLRAPLTFLVGVLLLEVFFAVLAGTGLFWGGLLLFLLMATIQIVTLILIWYVFRLVIRIGDRIKILEASREGGVSNQPPQPILEKPGSN